MRINKAAVFSHRADAVSVAVGRQAGMAVFSGYGFAQLIDMRLDRLRIDAGEQGVDFLADRNVIDSMFGKNAFHHAAPGAVHGVNCEFQVCFGNQIQIGEFAHGLDVRRLEIELFDLSALAGRHRLGAQFVFDLPHDGGGGGSAEFRFELHAVPVPGIVAGRHHDSAGSALLLDGERDSGSGRVVVSQLDRNACPGDDVGHQAREAG